MSYHVHIISASGPLKSIYAIKHVRACFGFGLKEAKDIIDRARTSSGVRLEQTRFWDDKQLRKFQIELSDYGFGVEFIPIPDSEEDFEYRNSEPEEKDESEMSMRDVMIYRMEWRKHERDKHSVNSNFMSVQDVLDDPFPRKELEAMSDLDLLDAYTESSSSLGVAFC